MPRERCEPSEARLTQNVLVTGGSQGLGLGIAKLLASQGANVVICSRTEAKLRTAVAEIEVRHPHAVYSHQAQRVSTAQQIRYVAADVSRFSGASAAVEQCGTPDAVFCCAGGAKPGFFLEQDEQDFKQAVTMDYMTAVASAHAAAHAMVRSNVRGKIVLVSSLLGFFSFIGYAQYAPMKYAIRGESCLPMC